VLELDPTILQIGHDELGFEPSDRIRVEIGDARLSIAALPDDGFDLVIGDAFGGISVPWHLTTSEFLGQVDRVLRPGGRYVMNLIDGPALLFARAETATLRTTFRHVALITDRDALEGRRGANIVLVAAHTPLESGAIAARLEADDPTGQTHLLAGDGPIDGFAAGAPVLRDDFAPVDQLVGR
jgi:SAM-dependent methyltransferase